MSAIGARASSVFRHDLDAGRRRRRLRGSPLSVREREVVVVLPGPSGSGKSRRCSACSPASSGCRRRCHARSARTMMGKLLVPLDSTECRAASSARGRPALHTLARARADCAELGGAAARAARRDRDRAAARRADELLERRRARGEAPPPAGRALGGEQQRVALARGACTRLASFSPTSRLASSDAATADQVYALVGELVREHDCIDAAREPRPRVGEDRRPDHPHP